MKIEIIQEINGIRRITTVDERWYTKEVDGQTIFVPSVTWIASYYPKGIAFYKWLAQKGWDEAESIKQSAGNKGSKVHQAIHCLLEKKSMKIDTRFINSKTGDQEELTPEEYECVMAFADWFNETKPEIISSEIVVFNNEIGYAGTVDLVCRIDGKFYIIDYKTSQYIWPEHELQISGYRHAQKTTEEISTAILQLGYRLNKRKYKFTEIIDKFDLFLASKKIWAEECSKVQPLQKDYLLEIKLK
jgi:hypothetical protein